MSNVRPIDTARINAYRAYAFERTQVTMTPVYTVQFDNAHFGYYAANSLIEARKLARQALKDAFNSKWNQILIFRGDLPEDEVSEVQLRTALRKAFGQK